MKNEMFMVEYMDSGWRLFSLQIHLVCFYFCPFETKSEPSSYFF